MEPDLQERPVYPLAQQVNEALAGAVFPLLPRQLVWVALQNEAPATLVSLLSGLAPRRFGSVDEVIRAV